jgi:putative transposase
MAYDSEIHQRRSIRLKGYDYTQAGAFFITICTQGRECLFGKINNGKMTLHELGRIVESCWVDIPNHFPNAGLDEFVIMPKRIHGIIVLNDTVGERHTVPLQPDTKRKHVKQFGKPVSGSIPTIVRSFKSAATRHIYNLRESTGNPVWQRNHYEHIIRNENALHRISEYIINNPLNRQNDEQNI